jgi:transcriptional regulator with XRE-family HTH domain
MAKSKKNRVEQPEVVRHFAVRLRELRRSRGLSQAELARQATVTPSYVTRLENGSSAPNLDTLSRLATALNVTLAELLPATAPANPVDALRQQAHRLSALLIDRSDRETLLMLCPLLARLTEAPTHNH